MKIAIPLLTEVTLVSTANLRHKRKQSLLLMLWKSFVCRPEISPKYLHKLKLASSPAWTKKPG